MLIVLTGGDTVRRQKRLEALLAPERANGADIQAYSDVAFDADTIRSLAENPSLFGQKVVCVISGLGDMAEKREQFEDIAEGLAASQELFILSETSLPAGFMKRMKAIGIEPEVFEQKAAKKPMAFNVFALTDAYSARNRSQSWALYRSAIEAGIEPRELHGKFFWIVKTMLLAKHSSTAEEVGIHPFAYGKAKTAAKNFGGGELEAIMTELCVLVHESMLSGVDLETALEAFVLRSLGKAAQSA